MNRIKSKRREYPPPETPITSMEKPGRVQSLYMKSICRNIILNRSYPTDLNTNNTNLYQAVFSSDSVTNTHTNTQIDRIAINPRNIDKCGAR